MYRPTLSAVRVAVLGTLIAASTGWAQSGAVVSGVRGRVVVDPALLDAERLPLNEAQTAAIRQGSWVSRPTGRPVRPLYGPARSLKVFVDGARATKSDIVHRLVAEGFQLSPSGLTAVKGEPIEVENRHPFTVSIVEHGGAKLVDLGPGEAKRIAIDPGTHELDLNGQAHTRTTVRVLKRARVLPVREDGFIEAVPVDGGDYQLAFFHGAKPLLVQGLSVPDNRFIAIDARISATGVVTVSVKDGQLQVAEPIRHVAPPRPPPPRPNYSTSPQAPQEASDGPLQPPNGRPSEQ